MAPELTIKDKLRPTSKIPCGSDTSLCRKMESQWWVLPVVLYFTGIQDAMEKVVMHCFPSIGMLKLQCDGLIANMVDISYMPTILTWLWVITSSHWHGVLSQGVTAILSSTAPDVLSHVAVRSRNTSTLLAACLDSVMFQEMMALEGHLAVITLVQVGQPLAPSTGGEISFFVDQGGRFTVFFGAV